jgi:HAMP domain-containing protein
MSRILRKKESKRGIRKKIMLSFTILSIISLSLILGITMGFFTIINDTTTQRSNQALITQIKLNIQDTSNENAKLIEELITNRMNDVEKVVMYAENLFDNPDEFGFRKSYNDTDPTAPGLNGTWDGFYKQLVSYDYSCYHLAPGTYTGNYNNTSPMIKELTNTSANLDFMFKYLKQQNPNYAWIYMGFEAGIHRSYPWHIINPSYDPRIRSWYSLASSNPQTIQITSPYIDSSGLGLMISLTKSVHYDNGTKIGVIAADLTIDTIITDVLQISILDSGYAFLIDTDGDAVAHPNSADPNTKITDLEPIPVDLLNKILTLSDGLDQFIKNDEPFYIAHSRVENTNFIMVVLVPETEVIASSNQLSTEIDTTSLFVMTETIIIIIVAIISSIIIGLLIAGKITKPVKRLTNVVQNLTKYDISATLLNPDKKIELDENLVEQKDEIGEMARAFKNMLDIIRKDAIEKRYSS